MILHRVSLSAAVLSGRGYDHLFQKRGIKLVFMAVWHVIYRSYIDYSKFSPA